ncbi:hypothetical protein SESBI_17906 [Sesbania bispinosa]|nr:hypothetical protein SESBI_17906 [Sesbania bispinosa]
MPPKKKNQSEKMMESRVATMEQEIGNLKTVVNEIKTEMVANQGTLIVLIKECRKKRFLMKEMYKTMPEARHRKR